MKTLKYVAPVLLLAGGLIHLLPNVLTPLAELGYGILTIQRVIGLVSVMVAIWMFVAPENK